MSRRGNCWDNAVVESFFSSLKKERIKKHIYKNRELAIAAIADYIDTFYNRTRRHSIWAASARKTSRQRRNGASLASTKSWELHFFIAGIAGIAGS
jgi:transposase InsO family protein